MTAKYFVSVFVKKVWIVCGSHRGLSVHILDHLIMDPIPSGFVHL